MVHGPGCLTFAVSMFCLRCIATSVPCLPGQYLNNTDDFECTNCTIGYYCLGGSRAPRTICPGGTYCPAASLSKYVVWVSDCTPASAPPLICPHRLVHFRASLCHHPRYSNCSAGNYSLAGATAATDCLYCPSGKFSTAAQAVCSSCAGGYYSTSLISPGGCVICPAGYYSAAGAGLSTCSPCINGYYSITNGAPLVVVVACCCLVRTPPPSLLFLSPLSLCVCALSCLCEFMSIRTRLVDAPSVCIFSRNYQLHANLCGRQVRRVGRDVVHQLHGGLLVCCQGTQPCPHCTRL